MTEWERKEVERLSNQAIVISAISILVSGFAIGVSIAKLVLF